jgi:DNA-binding MarR family transcriptional regulator
MRMARTRQAIIDQLGQALQAYQRSTQAFDDEVGRVLDLNPVDLRCLDWLTEGPMPASRLAEATGLSSAATTSMIDRLERKGFVRRVRHDADRRQVLVELSEAGQARTWAIYGGSPPRASTCSPGSTRPRWRPCSRASWRCAT